MTPFEMESLDQLNISEQEFFMELRQEGVEHLGQVMVQGTHHPTASLIHSCPLTLARRIVIRISGLAPAE